MKNKILLLSLAAALSAVGGEKVITPNDFTGSDSERIAKAIAEGVRTKAFRMTIPAENRVRGENVWILDRTIEIPSDFSLLIKEARLVAAPGFEGPLVSNTSAKGGKSDKNIELLGLGSRKGALVGAKAILVKNVNGFIFSNFEVCDAKAGAIEIADGVLTGRLSNVRFTTPVPKGIVVADGCRQIEVHEIVAPCDGVAAVPAAAGWASNLWATVSDGAADLPIPALMPAPRKLKKGRGYFGAPSAYVTRDWISFSRDAKLPAEGYRLSVRPTGVTVVAADANGELHAMTTLRQLAGEKMPYRNCDFYDGGDWGRPLRVPCCEIEDWPAYRWRGMLIDEGRHFFGKETVKHVLDQMAYHKYNVLHWHLTEDQGWRIALDRFPKLVEYGSVRPHSPVHFDYAGENNGEKYGPFYYTKDEIREIVAYAAARGITVVPEVEFPGHIRAALAGYPEYSCVGPTLPRVPRTTWGIEDDVLCVGNDEALRFVEQVLDEVVPLFPGEFFHIGGDECPTKRWKECPKCIARAKELGLAGPEKLQGWVTKRFTEYLAKKGKRVLGWDEILECDIPTASGVMSWRGTAGGIKASRLGHDVVMCPQSHCYFNRMQGIADDPFTARNKSQCVSLEKVYRFDPVAGIPAEYRAHVLGSQACFWSEVIWNRYDLDWKMWPRACALAEVLWTSPEKRDFAEFKARMAAYRQTLIGRGVNCAPLD